MEEKDYSPCLTTEELDAILEDNERDGGITNGIRFNDVKVYMKYLYEEFGDKNTPSEKFFNFLSNIYQNLLRMMRLTK